MDPYQVLVYIAQNTDRILGLLQFIMMLLIFNIIAVPFIRSVDWAYGPCRRCGVKHDCHTWQAGVKEAVAEFSRQEAQRHQASAEAKAAPQPPEAKP